MVAQIDTAFLRTRPAKLWPRLVGYALFEGRPLTTRGRWINPLVLAGYGLWARLPFGPAPDRPVLILGTGRSGTTVLGRILALHPDVGYLNEPKALWHAALGCDDVIGSYSARPGRLRLGPGDVPAGALGRLRRFYAAYARLSGSRRVVDKYPELIFRAPLTAAAFPDARRIVIVRDGAEVCASIAEWSRRHGKNGGGDDWWGHRRRKWHALLDEVVAPDAAFAGAMGWARETADQVAMGAVEWIATMREAQRLAAGGPAAPLLVRYEDLVAAPEAEMARILDFAGLAPDPVLLAYARDVLAPRPPRPAPLLPEPIADLFAQTRAAFGYG